MYIKELDNSFEEKYLKLSGDNSVFNSFEWKRNVHGDYLKIYGLFDDDNQLTGAFHLYKEKKFGFNFVKNPPYIPHIGLIYNNKATNKANSLSFDKKMTEQIAEFLNKTNYGVISIALPDYIIDGQHFFWNKFKVIPNYTYHLNLNQSLEDIEKGFAPEHRNSLKKAIKDGVEVELTTDYSLVKKMVLSTFERRNKGVYEVNVNDILFKHANTKNSFAYIAKFNGQIIAAAFCLYDKKTCCYLLGGYDKTSKHSGGGIMCIYNSILKAKELNIPVFDFEGSMIKDVEKYFRSFGADLVPYLTINKAKLPFEFVLKFVKRELF